ncbi:MAG: hypothetical protein A4E35_02255 [Methanoregula sp. PtaU1.Bin051]|nr:MAG: hypothetical protein A4E35_02255 [Methanoregula sp. PtaU1.Bin051]
MGAGQACDIFSLMNAERRVLGSTLQGAAGLYREKNEPEDVQMDKVIKIATGIFIIILVVVAGTGVYTFFTERQYRESLTSTYSYSLTISANEELRNVTLFVPLPANPAGYSPVEKRFSLRQVQGLPPAWETSLLGSNKGTAVKIRTASLGSGTGATVVTLTLEEPAGQIDTRAPETNSVLFWPVQDLKTADCSGFADPKAGASCYRYLSAIYADYDSSPNARVEISSTITGKNEWTIFKPDFNEYTSSISVLMLGENHGWVVAKGELQAGIGSYNVPKI